MKNIFYRINIQTKSGEEIKMNAETLEVATRMINSRIGINLLTKNILSNWLRNKKAKKFDYITLEKVNRKTLYGYDKCLIKEED